VGAPQESSNTTGVNGDQTDNSATNSGAVYVYTRTNGVWTQQAYLKASNTSSGDMFGVSVAIDGDTLAVGATSESSNATGVNGDQTNHLAPNSGAVYVFTRTAGVWSQQAYLKASNTNADDNFGVTVALKGDTLAVAAYEEASNATGVNGNQADNSAPGSGAVYVFTRTSGVWSQQAYLKASNTDAGDLFGYEMALGSDTLAVGAPFEASSAIGVNGDQVDNSASGSGAVYVYTRTAGVWSQQAYLKASNTDAGDRFGHDLKIDGETLAVSARLEASAASGVPQVESTPIKLTIVRRAPGRFISSRGPASSGLSRLILKPPTRERIGASAVASQLRETLWPWGHDSKIAMRLGSMAIRQTVTRRIAARSIYSSEAAACGHRHTM
jgi:hypothetical protein